MSHLLHKPNARIARKIGLVNFILFCLVSAFFSRIEARAEQRCANDAFDCQLDQPKVVGNVEVIVTPAGISPEHVRINPGTTVIWVNNAPGEIRVVFPERKISTTCRDARGFELGNTGIERSETLSRGEIASLCPLEENVYQYDVEYIDTSGNSAALALRKAHGAISVD